MRLIKKYLFKFSNKPGVPLFMVFALIFFSFNIVNKWENIKSDSAANELVTISKRILLNDKYSFDVNYSSYKEHNETSVYESQNGHIIKDGLNLYSKVNGAITIQNKDIRIVVDSAKKFIKISNPIEGQDPNFNIKDYIKILEICKTVKRMEVNKTIAYRFEPKAKRGIVAQEIYFSEDFLNKSVIYYVNENNIRENNKIIKEIVYPRLEVTMTNYKKLEKVDQKTFSTEDFIHVRKKTIELKGKYKTYKYFDGRYKK